MTRPVPTRLANPYYRPRHGRASETSVLGHVAVRMARGRGSTARTHDRAAIASIAWFTALAVFPDIDLLPGGSHSVGLGAFTHRGATHSLALATAVDASCGVVARTLERRDWIAFGLLCAAAMGSHGILDVFSQSNVRLPLLWPISKQGYLGSVAPAAHPPAGTHALSERGALTVLAELVWFLPVGLYALWPRRGGTALGAPRGCSVASSVMVLPPRWLT